MGFDRRDLQDDDDDFNFDDFDNDAGKADENDFTFEDEPGDIGLEDDDTGFGFEDEDMPVIEEEEVSEGPGINRTFVIIAALMIGVFVIGLIVLLVIVSRPQPPTPTELTATYIVQQNATTQALLIATQTAAVEVANASATAVEIANATGTAEAVRIAQAATEAALATPTPSETPTLDPTQEAANALLTSTAVALTQVALDQTATADALLAQPPTPEVLQPNDVALTATALAILLQPPTPGQGGGLIPTQEVFGPDPRQTPGALLTIQAQLPPDSQANVPGLQLTLASLLTPAVQLPGAQVPPGAEQTPGALLTLAVQLTPGAPGVFGTPGVQPTFAALLTPAALLGGQPVVGVPTALPETGFFDDLASGGTNVGAFALMAAGLLAVIIISRRLRATNSR